MAYVPDLVGKVTQLLDESENHRDQLTVTHVHMQAWQAHTSLLYPGESPLPPSSGKRS